MCVSCLVSHFCHLLSISCCVAGSQGNLWKQISLELTHISTQVYLQFEGTVEHSGGAYAKVKGEMAIDDVILTKRSACSDLSGNLPPNSLST